MNTKTAMLLAALLFGLASAYNLSNITYNGSVTNVTLAAFQSSTSTFYTDWSPYAFAILSFGFSFILTSRYSATMTGGGIGMIFIYFFTSNPMFLAGGIFSVLMGYLMKYLTG